MQETSQTKGAAIVIVVIGICIAFVAVAIYLFTRPKLDTIENAQKAMGVSEDQDIMAGMDMTASTTPDGSTTSPSLPGPAKTPQQRTSPKNPAHWVVLAGSASHLYEFNKADYDEAVRSDKLVVLYFYADWCPFCAVEYPILKNVFNEMTRSDVVGFRVHYNDESTGPDERTLARQFGVGYQHTKVFLKNGVRVLKSPESWTQDRYVLEIAKF